MDKWTLNVRFWDKANHCAGSKFLDIVKNAPIWLKFGVSNAFDELISHNKYEQNRSIFDDVQNFGPNYFDDTEKHNPKILICCYKKAN